MDNKKKTGNSVINPECFIPEPHIAYPLCIGNGSAPCESCCLYTEFDDNTED